jgi:hypothetical protein
MQESLGRLQNGLHSLLVSAIQTMEDTGQTVCDVTDTAPWEDTMALARQVWDTSRHIEIFLKLLERIAGYSSATPETTTVERGASAEPAPPGQGYAVLAQLIELAHHIGDPVSARALDSVLADVCMRGRKDQPYAVA